MRTNEGSGVALRVMTSEGRGLVGPAVVAELRAGLAASGHATLLAPSFAQALAAQRELVEVGGLGLGVSVETPSSWVAERWEVWGDGTHIVDATARLALASQVLRRAGGSVPTPGVVRTFCDLVRSGLPWLVGEGSARAAACEGLTEAERRLVALAVPYAQALADYGLVEESQVMCAITGRLQAAGVALGSVVFVGFDELSLAVRQLAEDLAGATEVVLVSVGAELDKPEAGLRMVLPAGPLAEAPAVVEEIERLVGEGAQELVVAGSDARRLWRELAPRLAVREFAVDGQYSVPFSATAGGRAFLQFARGVAQMAELAEVWPRPVPQEKNLEVGIGDMSWWPPRDLSDFLMSDISGVPADNARRLDARWRGNRLLSPQAVLNTLQNEKETSAQVVAATRELLRGRLGSAASKLLAPLVEGEGAVPAVDAAGSSVSDLLVQTSRRENAEALASVLNMARTLGDLGISADSEAGTVSLAELVDVAALALGQSSVVVRLRAADTDRAQRVRILPVRAASQLAPRSVDALVACGLTSHESAIPRDPGVAAELLAVLGIEELSDPLQTARAQFARLLAISRSYLSLERALFTTEGRDAYSSVMLIELLARYGIEAGGKPRDFREAVQGALELGGILEHAETVVSRNVSSSGSEARASGSDRPQPAGIIDPALERFVSPPPNGTAMAVDEPPLLSASQIETYLDCPYKWFSLRRLRLGDADAGFGGAEMGTFAHRVLEVTHQQMLAEAAAAHAEELLAVAAERGIEVPMREDAPTEPNFLALSQLMADVRLPGSRVDLHHEETLTRAQELLGAEFDLHSAHMYYLIQGRRPQPQALVPHDAQQEASLEVLRKDLESSLAYEGRLFYGYEPRFFEWTFGRQDAVDYAGVRLVGTIDRVDVDAHGQAAVIDYKHKAPGKFASEYDVFSSGKREPGDPFDLPRRVQSLIYAQVVRRRHPELNVTAAVYLGTKGDHALAGAVATNALDNVFGDVGLSSRREGAVAVSTKDDFGRGDAEDGSRGMNALLDATEAAIAERMRELVAGNIEARPIDAAACEWCPVLNCSRRVSS